MISKECKVNSDNKNEEFIRVIDDKSTKTYYNELIKFYNKREELKNLSHKIHLYSKENFSIDYLIKWLPRIYKNCINHTLNINNP